MGNGDSSADEMNLKCHPTSNPHHPLQTLYCWLYRCYILSPLSFLYTHEPAPSFFSKHCRLSQPVKIFLYPAA